MWRWDSSPFGDTAANEDADGDGIALNYNPRFLEQLYDAETGLYYNYHRDYNPETGRYVQSDPIGLAGGLNTFGYVNQNPYGYVDPDGRIFKLAKIIFNIAKSTYKNGGGILKNELLTNWAILLIILAHW